ncbi:MAG: hypothetical protein V3U68_02895 [Bacteroidota bacterium]
MRTGLILVIMFCAHLPAICGEPTPTSLVLKTESHRPPLLTGNLRIDFFSQDLLGNGGLVYSNANISGQTTGARQSGGKSSWLAAGLSAAVPGVGEFYSKSYLKSAIFLGTEVVSWIIYGVYTKRGNDRTDEYEAYANVHWTVADYALWMNRHKDCSVNVSADKNLPPQGRVNWDELNACERTVKGFSHILPPFDTQQYYELIGKYAQYTPGWDDSDTTVFIDYAEARNLDRVTPRFRFYRDMRGDANDFFNTASTAVGLVVVNHILSALDAAWSASRFNRGLEASVRLEIHRLGEIREVVPTIDVTVSF